jgi:hypothetical protein
MATLTRGIKLAEFSSMTETEKDRRVNELFQAALSPTEDQLNEQLAEVDGSIRAFEVRYRMSSGEMKHLLCNGEIKESADFCSWLMLLKIRGNFDTTRGSSRPNPL